MAIPSQIGFHVPYTWDDSTYMACSLADFASRLGLPVSILSNQAHETSLHHRWDNLVLSGKRNNYSLWQSGCSHLVWFDVQKHKVAQAHREGRRNILVPLWHRLTAEHLEVLPLYDTIVCTHRALYDRLATLPCKAIHAYWDCGLPFVSEAMPSTTRRIYMPVDAYTARTIGLVLLNTIRILLDFDADTMFTVSYSKNWARPTFNALGDLIRAHPDRVRVMKKPTFAERVEAYQRHDWVFLPALRESTGLVAQEALCCRKPVVCFDYQPHRELLQDGLNAKFVPCEIALRWLDVPEAVVNSYDLAEQLRTLVEQPQIMQDMVEKPWPSLQDWRNDFTAQWKQVWEFG